MLHKLKGLDLVQRTVLLILGMLVLFIAGTIARDSPFGFPIVAVGLAVFFVTWFIFFLQFAPGRTDAEDEPAPRQDA